MVVLSTVDVVANYYSNAAIPAAAAAATTAAPPTTAAPANDVDDVVFLSKNKKIQ